MTPTIRPLGLEITIHAPLLGTDGASGTRLAQLSTQVPRNQKPRPAS